MDLVNKYRPVKLSQVIGQKAAVAILRGTFKQRDSINPVTLFCGPHSTGKTTLAWLLALYSNCKEPAENGEACRKCDSCKNIVEAIRSGTDGRSVIEKPVSERGIEAIRQLANDARYRCIDRYRWFILDEVHNLTKPAFDAALRLLEKPQGQSRFILCTTAPETLPRTIRSRNWIYTLQSISPETTAKELLWPVIKREKFQGIDQKTALEIAKKVHGHPRDALNLLAQWAAALEGGVSPEDAPRVMGALEAVTPYEAIVRYTKAVIHGNLVQAIYALKFCGSHEYFVSQVLELLREVLYRWLLSDKLGRPRYDTDVKKLDIPEKRRVNDLSSLLEMYVDAQDQIKQYRCDNQAILESTTITVCRLTKGWK